MNDQAVSPEESYPRKFGNYRVIKRINTGAFSVVCLVQNEKNGQQYAAKIISRSILKERETITHLEQELRLQKSLTHENICQLIEIIYETDYIIAILEYCQNGELFEFIIRNQKLHVGIVKKLFAQTVAAINYLHNKNIAHRDLKPENIFLDANFNAKLGDFGFCHTTKEHNLLSTACGSVYYVAPEIIKGQQYDGKKSDIWSLGVILFVMLTGSLPWSEQNQARLYTQIENADFKIPMYVPKEAQEIIKMCMTVDPDKRPTAADLMKTHYVSSALEEVESKSAEDETKQYNSVAVLKKKKIIIRPSVSQSTRIKIASSAPTIILKKKNTLQGRGLALEAPQ